jgi:hypothetical protein
LCRTGIFLTIGSAISAADCRLGHFSPVYENISTVSSVSNHFCVLRAVFRYAFAGGFASLPALQAGTLI